MPSHFSSSEFKCKCGCGTNYTQDLLLEILEYIRAQVDEPVYINSSTRCEAHNAAVGGSPRSQHLLGTAADIRCKRTSAEDLYRLIDDAFPTSLGLGNYPTFVHVDVRKGCARW